MNDLMSIKRVSTFERILAAYANAGIDLHNALDGGAGSGATAKAMLTHLGESAHVYAFEPFPGNHRFFLDCGPRIELIPKALAEISKTMSFHVPSVVSADTEWGKRGMAGYSSVGFLRNTDDLKTDPKTILVDCVRADDVISDKEKIGFIKLDLQGGELNALKGMTRLLKSASVLWVEFIGKDPFLLDYIIDSGYIVFDTEYFFMGRPTDEAQKLFDVSRQDITLSTNASAWFGFKKRPWNDFMSEFKNYQDAFKLVQTDLLCINKEYVDQFLAAGRYL